MGELDGLAPPMSHGASAYSRARTAARRRYDDLMAEVVRSAQQAPVPLVYAGSDTKGTGSLAKQEYYSGGWHGRGPGLWPQGYEYRYVHRKNQ